MPPSFRIVLAGGPSGAKTTALAKLQERLTSLWFRVLLVPEATNTLPQGRTVGDSVGRRRGKLLALGFHSSLRPSMRMG